MGQNCPGLPTVRHVFVPAEMGAHVRRYKICGTDQVPTVRYHGEVESRQARQNTLNLRDSVQNVSYTVLICPSRLYDSV
jgi:hypothetical protein